MNPWYIVGTVQWLNENWFSKLQGVKLIPVADFLTRIIWLYVNQDFHHSLKLFIKYSGGGEVAVGLEGLELWTVGPKSTLLHIFIYYILYILINCTLSSTGKGLRFLVLYIVHVLNIIDHTKVNCALYLYTVQGFFDLFCT